MSSFMVHFPLITIFLLFDHFDRLVGARVNLLMN